MTTITIWVAVYEHRCGPDIEVYGTKAEAELLWQRIAAENWDDKIPILRGWPTPTSGR
jgi:hypothetical protein